MTEKAPERIIADVKDGSWFARDKADDEGSIIDCDEVAYVREDLLATVRAEAQSRFVNNIAAVLDADGVEAFTALIMKAKASPDLNSETRSALKSEAEIRAEEREAAQKVGRQAFAAELLGQLDRITSTTAAFHLVKNLCKIELGRA